jgi:hypothetical protein
MYKGLSISIIHESAAVVNLSGVISFHFSPVEACTWLHKRRVFEKY